MQTTAVFISYRALGAEGLFAGNGIRPHGGALIAKNNGRHPGSGHPIALSPSKSPPGHSLVPGL
jgi:hypothetical protein